MADKGRIDEMMREKLENIQVTPSAKVWENIEAQLPFPRRIQWWRYTGGISLVAVIAIGGLFMSPTSTEKAPGPAPLVQYAAFDLPQAPTNVSERTVRRVAAATKELSAETATDATSQHEILLASNETSVDARPLLNKLSVRSLPKAVPAYIPGPKTPESLLAFNTIDRVERLPAVSNEMISVPENEAKLARKKRYMHKRYAVRGLHVGPVARLSNSWILNQNTHYEFGTYELAYELDHGVEYGVSIGYDFSNTFGLQAEFIRSSQGQRYNDVIANQDVEREVNLTYVKVPVIAKYKATQRQARTKLPISRNYIFGLEYSYLKTAQESVNNVEKETTRYYADHNLGIVLGVEFDVYVSKYSFFTLGGRSTISSNINGLRANLYDDYKKSHNMLIGAHAGFSVILK